MEEKKKLYQKWWFWVIILLIVIIVSITSVIILGTLAAIGSETIQTGVPTSSSYMNTGIATSTEELKNNISIEYLGITKRGDFAIKVKNDNDIPVCISEISTVYKDTQGNFIEKATTYDNFFGIDAKSEIVVYNWGFDKDFSKYPKYEFKFEFANISNDFLYNNFEITANNTGEQIAVQVKNNNKETTSSISVNVIYYKNGQIVGIENGYNFETTAQGQSAYINVPYPENSNYKTISFDDYKVYLVQASKN